MRLAAMSKTAFALIISSLLLSVKSQWSGPNQLQPVHGLYVKASSDGTTGDLYVAATEDSGTKAQWLTDQPVNFLSAPVSQATTNQIVPVAFHFPTHEETSGSNTQKRAIINQSAPVQYAYAVPFNPTEGAQPHHALSTNSNPESPSQCTCGAGVVPHNPYQFFYPQLMQASMQAYANAKNLLKDAGLSDEKANAVIPQASPFWPSSYSYPPYPMYVMMDPSAWAQSQSTQSSNVAAAVET